MFSYEFPFLPHLRDVKILYVQCVYQDVLFYVSSLEEQVSQKLLKHPIFMESVCKTALFHVIYFLHDLIYWHTQVFSDLFTLTIDLFTFSKRNIDTFTK